MRVRTTVHISTQRQQLTTANIRTLDMAAAMNHCHGAESYLGGQIIPHLLWNPTVHNTPPLVPILNQINPFHALLPCSFTANVNTFLSTQGASKWSLPTNQKLTNVQNRLAWLFVDGSGTTSSRYDKENGPTQNKSLQPRGRSRLLISTNSPNDATCPPQHCHIHT